MKDVREGDYLYCIEKYYEGGYRVKINIGEKCRVEENNGIYLTIITISKKTLNISIDYIDRYFKTVSEHRKKIIEDLL